MLIFTENMVYDKFVTCKKQVLKKLHMKGLNAKTDICHFDRICVKYKDLLTMVPALNYDQKD